MRSYAIPPDRSGRLQGDPRDRRWLPHAGR